MDETPKTPTRQRRRRIVTVAVITVFAVVGLAELAYAATYQMGSVTYNNACGAAAMNSVFNSTAVDDTVSSKTAKVDFNNFTESARIYLPGSCAPATQVCLDERIIAYTTTGGFTSSAPFGDFAYIWGNYRQVFSGTEGSAYGTNCRSIDARSAIVTANPTSDETVFIYTGYYPLANYTFQTRVRYYQSGAWHYGSWNTFKHSY